MDEELKRLEKALQHTTENLYRFLKEIFGSEDDPRAVELLRLTSLKEVAEDALVTHMLDTMPMEDENNIPPPPPKPDHGKNDRFIH